MNRIDKRGPDAETYWVPRGGTECHKPTCPRSQYAQAGKLGEDCGCEPADPLVEALKASLERRGPR